MSGQKLGYKRKQKISKTLEKAVTAAARKPVVVVVRSDTWYQIANYYTNQIVLNFDIRSRTVAELVAEVLNTTGSLNGQTVRDLSYMQKLLTDLVHYKHYLNENPVGPQAEIQDHRIEITNDRIKIVEQNLTIALKMQLHSLKKINKYN